MKVLTKAHESQAQSRLEQCNMHIAFQAACEGIVLLENSGVLPLQKGKVALYGAGASQTVKGGTGSGEVNVRHSVNVLEGLQNGGGKRKNKRVLQCLKEAVFQNDRLISIQRKVFGDQSNGYVDEILGSHNRAGDFTDEREDNDVGNTYHQYHTEDSDCNLLQKVEGEELRF